MPLILLSHPKPFRHSHFFLYPFLLHHMHLSSNSFQPLAFMHISSNSLQPLAFLTAVLHSTSQIHTLVLYWQNKTTTQSLLYYYTNIHTSHDSDQGPNGFFFFSSYSFVFTRVSLGRASLHLPCYHSL